MNAITEPGLLRTQYNRLGGLRNTIESVGLLNTLRVIVDRRLRRNVPRRTIRVGSSLLRHPLNVETVGSDIDVFREVIENEAYRLPTELRRGIDGQTIVDVGANIGAAAAYFASQYPRSTVLAFEPSSRNVSLLRANAAAYGEQIKPHAVALGSEAGWVGMAKMEPNHPGCHVDYAFSRAFASEDTEERVPTVTGEQIAGMLADPGRVGILKIDIEGAEKEVFESSTIAPLLARTDILMIETHDEYVPGCSRVVRATATGAGLHIITDDGHTAVYARR